jgi:hypothetical protein
MAWAPGPSEVASISVGGTSTAGNLVEGFTIATTPESYTAANGLTVDRGYVTKQGSFNMLNYDNVTALQALMTLRTLSTVVVTYTDSDTQTLTSNCAIKVTPLVNQVPDSCAVYIDPTGAGDYVSITGAGDFVNVGVVVGQPTFTFDFPGEETDGCGRPYFSGTCHAVAEFELAGVRGATTDVYDLVKGYQNTGTAVDVAFQLSSGNFMAIEGAYVYAYYGDEDSSGPRTVRVRVEAVGSTWSTMLKYTNGGATPDINAWGVTTEGVDPGNTFAGAMVEFTGSGYTESSVTVIA